MLINYLRQTGSRRLIIMIIGNVFLGLGISIFKLSGMGNDPANALVMALSDVVGIPYAVFIIIFNVFVFIIEFIFGRHFIGAGTIVNACLLGYVATFFYNHLLELIGKPQFLWQQLIIVCIGVIVTSFGVSMYQTPDVGISPYDSLSLITTKRWPKIPYFWHRMFFDAISALICYLAGGIIGLGTLLSAFCLGPFVHFFNEKFVKKLVGPVDKDS